MKCLNIKLRLSFLIIILLAISCKKDRSLNDENEEVYSVNFKLSGFTSQVYPMKNGVNKIAKLASSSNGTGAGASEYLYFWSFNESNLLPDILFHPSSIPEIVYVDGLEPYDFVVSTYKFDGFGDGKAINFNKGAKEILIKMPLPIGTQLGELAFDVGSPSTGPKDFEIYYSLDKGESYEVLRLDNQFEDPSENNQRQSFSYDLSEMTLGTQGLWIKISPMAGEREGAGTFSIASGFMRMDNLRITGIPPPSDLAYDEVHYFIFSKENDELVASGKEDLTGLGSIELSLSGGEYHMVFVANTSNEELILPSNINRSTFYVSNTFSNADAEIFGFTGELSVNESQTVPIELVRLYSQVKVEFLDTGDLSAISKIEVEQVHEPFFYAPFNIAMQNPVTDESTILLFDEFQDSSHVVFNQFMGKFDVPKSVSYLLHIYIADELVRTVVLDSAMKNNMQLLFKGTLFLNQEENSSFQIVKNVIWNDEIVINF